MKTNTTPENDDRVVALLGLAASGQEPPGRCPTDDELALFAGGGLEGERRDAMLSHLNRCPACYEVWLGVAAALEDHAPEAGPAWHERLARWFAGTLSAGPAWGLPVAAGAAAVCVLAVTLFFGAGTDGLQDRIDARYAAVQASARGDPAAGMAEAPWPWQADVRALMPEDPASQAFRAGLWEGREAFSGGPATPAPGRAAEGWEDYYELGRWTVLAWLIATDPELPVDWAAQAAIREALAERMARRDDDRSRQAAAAIDGIDEAMAALQGDPGRGARRALQRRVVMLMNTL